MARMSRPWRSGRRRGRAAHRATYSRWDGTQQVPDLDADALLKAMGDELIAHGGYYADLAAVQSNQDEDRERKARLLRDLGSEISTTPISEAAKL